ncbi:MAG: hypothetical protein KAX05_14600 [Bacteroidales bacterium]|nr:hypothetical protein [Bacteroidales bacterium]
MVREKKSIEFIDEQKEQTESKRMSVRGLIDGSLLTREAVIKQLPYIIFLTLLILIYIGNRYHAEKVVRKTVELQNEVRELRSEAITTSAELMFISKQSEVTKLVKRKNLELEELEKPPKIIEIH